MIYEYFCKVCKKEFEEHRPYERRNEVFCCGKKAVKLLCSNPQITNETRDYNFTTRNFGKPVHIYGKAQYKRLLKQHGFADATVKECLSVKPSTRESYKVTNKRKEIVNKIQKRLYEEGINQHLKGAIQAITKKNNKENSNGR